MRRAEKAGFKALVFTVDDPSFGKRCANIRNQFKLPPHLNLANFTNYSDPNFDPRLRDPTLTWDGISWLKTITNLPIIVKGILHPEDAILAVKQGVFSQAASIPEFPSFSKILIRSSISKF